MNQSPEGRVGRADDTGYQVMRMRVAALLGFLALVVVACGEETPTSVDPDLRPIEPTSVEVLLSWEEFGSNLEVFGGYGSVRSLGSGVLAHAFGGVLEARTLVRFGDFPTTASVPDTTGTQRTDTLLTLTGGRVVAFMDTVESVADGPVTLELGAMSQRWDAGSLSWEMAVDTTGDAQPWDEPGAGPVVQVSTGVWDPEAGDSVVFVLDSAQVELWRDTTEANQGMVLGLLSEGARLKVNNVAFRAEVIPSLRPDTLVDLSPLVTGYSFIYTPQPGTPSGELRVGGAPAWRSVLDIDVPLQLNGPASLCAAAGCPVQLTPTRVNYASLVLSSRATEAAFQPSDTLGIDVRAVFQRSAGAKAPLGASMAGALGRRLAPSLFSSAAGSQVEIPITTFVRNILAGDSVSGFPPPESLALLSIFEPSSITYASFQGPGMPGAPVLKLIVTAGSSVQLP